MATTASLAFLLRPLLLFLLSGWRHAGWADSHSLWYNFTVIHLPRPGQRWCEVQGQVDQKNFLSYDCDSDKVLSVGCLEEQLNATDAWGRQLEMLSQVGQRLRLELPGIELEDFTPSGPVMMQARMSCECEADGHSKASWEFRFHGQKFLLFDSNSRKWTVVHAGARRMKEKWEEDRELTELFRKVSIGDCRSWLLDFLICREKRLEPTGLLFLSSPLVCFWKSMKTTSNASPEILPSPPWGFSSSSTTAKGWAVLSPCCPQQLCEFSEDRGHPLFVPAPGPVIAAAP
uniref:MHC class I-like antigen recognition-like domain-containing protein n=1 Tax=Callithrix jacchus TaxID=9483 RepID=A0A8I3WYM4_CALJA